MGVFKYFILVGVRRMLTKLKTPMAAVALCAMPMMASAATVNLVDGGTNTIQLGDNYEYLTTVTTPGAGSREFTLIASSQIALASSFVALEFTGVFDNLRYFIVTAAGQIDATPEVVSGPVRSYSLDTIFDSLNGYTQTVKVTWDDVDVALGNTTAQFNIQAVPSEVPVPAAGLLLISALGGVAALRRRRKA